MNPSFDFTKYLSQIESTGKKLYHFSFKVFAEDYEIIFKLLVYFLKDTIGAKKYDISFRKGILLSGPVGCGKTSLMNILKYFQDIEERYILKSCRDISFEFIKEGYSVIHKYSKQSFKNELPKVYCFDDLGTENNLKYYGDDCNVMAEILLSRYNYLLHFTPNDYTFNQQPKQQRN